MRAITRHLSPDLAACELSFVNREPIDVGRAQAQHVAYVDALSQLGCDVTQLPALPGHPDAVFVEDTALVLPELAVITRPGAASRQGETASIAQALSPHRTLARIDVPGTLDGGDVLRIGKRVFVGRSARSNDAGIAQLRTLLAPHGYTVQGVETRDCLHLKSAVTQVDDDTVLIQRKWVGADVFADYHHIEVDPEEEHAANALRIGGAVIHPSCFPRTQARLRDAGIRVVPVEIGELQKAEGAVTCCSLVFD